MSRYRHEYKYLIDAGQEGILRVRTAAILRPDPHVRSDGSYLIRSAYFDDLHDTCLEENLAGTDPRSKFRIRYYNCDTGRLTLEKKSKRRGMCLKESCSLTEGECRALLAGDTPPVSPDAPPIKKALLTELFRRGLAPKVIVTYERIPFVYEGGNVRVTFDRRLTSSNDVGRFLTGGYAQRPVLPTGHCVLEVKWDEALPRFIRDVLTLDGLTWTAFSKYYMCRRFHM